MSEQAIENLLQQAEQLPVDERLRLIERLAEGIRRLPVATATQSGLEERPALSKWAEMARRVRENPIPLGDYTEQLKRDMKLFRENFAFRHDES
jgi:hypothetical protein